MNTPATFRLGLIALAATAALACGTAMAQSASSDKVPGHGRVNEVNQRIDNQQARTKAGLANGTITGKQAARDESHDANIAQRASADEARHSGHLTKRETHRLDHAENRNSRAIHRQRH